MVQNISDLNQALNDLGNALTDLVTRLAALVPDPNAQPPDLTEQVSLVQGFTKALADAAAKLPAPQA